MLFAMAVILSLAVPTSATGMPSIERAPTLVGEVSGDDPPGARDEARQILNESRFQPPDVAPSDSQTDELGPDNAEGSGNGAGAGSTNGGPSVPSARLSGTSAWGPILLILVIAVVGFIVWMLLRNRQLAQPPGTDEDDLRAAARREADLWAEADRLAEQGRYSEALRVRYEGGLHRLGKTHDIEYRPAVSSGQAVEMFPDPVFSDLARTHGRVAYGDRPTTEAEYEASRVAWTETTQRGRARRRRSDAPTDTQAASLSTGIAGRDGFGDQNGDG